ncbi:MAG: hypothetical protein ACOCNY_07605, partial [Prevotella sp.]
LPISDFTIPPIVTEAWLTRCITILMFAKLAKKQGSAVFFCPYLSLLAKNTAFRHRLFIRATL